MSKPYRKLLPQNDAALEELHQFYREAVLELGHIDRDKAYSILLRTKRSNFWIAMQMEWWASENIAFQRATKFVRETLGLWPDS